MILVVPTSADHRKAVVHFGCRVWPEMTHCETGRNLLAALYDRSDERVMTKACHFAEVL